MRLAGALIAAACLLAPPAAQARARVPFGFFGMSVEGAMFAPHVDQSREFGRIARAGVESIITEVNWNFLQPREDEAPNWARPDSVVRTAARRGMRVMMNVLYAPGWAAVDPGNGASPPDPAKYAAFLHELVARYGTGGTFWQAHPKLLPLYVQDFQVWNEPPSPGFWSQQPFARDYVALLRAARFAIKGTDPSARVVLAGLTWRSWEDIAKIYRAGGQGLFDVVSLHPYTRRPQDVTAIVQAVRKVMARNGDGRLPVLITELSWPSAKGRSKDDYGYEVTRRQQAARVRAVLPLLAEARKRYRIERVYWFSWLSTDRGRYTFDYSGLRRIRGERIRDKPALAAFRRGVLALEGCRRKGPTARRCG